MTSYQEAYEKMSLVSTTFLAANATITASLPGFSNYFSVIQTTLTQIAPAKALQEMDKSGNTTAKRVLRDALVIQDMDVIRRLIAYASNEDDNALLNKIDYTESDLKRYSDSKLVSISQLAKDTANANISALGIYGITESVLIALQTLITNFSDTIPKNRVDTTDTGNVTLKLATYFSILKLNWAKIDKLIEMLRISEPAFYSEYQKVRKVIVNGKGSLALKIKVINAETGLFEANVILTITIAKGEHKGAKGKCIVKKTAKRGGAYVKNMLEGLYLFTAKKPGFKDANGTVMVVNGETTTLKIQMERV